MVRTTSHTLRLSVASLLFTAVFLAACTTEKVLPTTPSDSTNGTYVPASPGSPSTTALIPFDTGIEGTLTRSGNGSGDDGAVLEGQILVWGPRETAPRGTTTTSGLEAHGRPYAAADVKDGAFAVELAPGWYRVRGTAIDAAGGEACGELWVEVKSHELTGIEFVCR